MSTYLYWTSGASNISFRERATSATTVLLGGLFASVMRNFDRPHHVLLPDHNAVDRELPDEPDGDISRQLPVVRCLWCKLRTGTASDPYGPIDESDPPPVDGLCDNGLLHASDVVLRRI